MHLRSAWRWTAPPSPTSACAASSRNPSRCRRSTPWQCKTWKGQAVFGLFFSGWRCFSSLGQTEWKHKKFSVWLTCLCPVRSSRRVWRCADGPVPCVFCTLDKRACGGKGQWCFSLATRAWRILVPCSARHWGWWRGIIITVHGKGGRRSKVGECYGIYAGRRTCDSSPFSLLSSSCWAGGFSQRRSVALSSQRPAWHKKRVSSHESHKRSRSRVSLGSRLRVYLVNFTEAPSSQKVQEQVSLIQCRVIFKSAGRQNSNVRQRFIRGRGVGVRPLDTSTLARRVHRVRTPMRRPSEEWTQTHCELSSLFILFSSRMWRLRTLSRRSSSAWISASSYKWFSRTNTRGTSELGLQGKELIKIHIFFFFFFFIQLTRSVWNINSWVAAESVRDRLVMLIHWEDNEHIDKPQAWSIPVG